MEKKYDVSIHFSLKGQTIEEIEEKLDLWLQSENYQGQFDFSERDDEPRSVLHHCFLPKKIVEQKGFSTEVWDFLEMFSEDNVCWNGVSGEGMGLVWDRQYMLENIKKINGVSIFIGNIIEGVEEEYKLANELGIDIIVIP